MKDTKAFNVRIPKELWLFLKEKSAKDEISMSQIILRQLDKLKRRNDKKFEKNVLTESDTAV